MKTMRNLTIIGAIAALTTIACDKDKEKENNASTGNLSVMMTDAPANFTAVNVDVQSLEVHYDGSGWRSIGTNAGIYNLLELQDSVSVLIAANDSLPVGHITQMRLILGDSNTVVVDSADTFLLATPSARQSGLKVNMNADIMAGKETEVLLDFDAGASVVSQGNGSYLLKPVIKVEQVVYK